MSIITFGLKTTLVHFQDCYYSYKGVVEEGTDNQHKDNNRLSNEAFKAALCADVSTTFVYEMCKEIISKFDYVGTYWDDRLTIFAGRRKLIQTIKWLQNDQCKVDEVVGRLFFQFMAEL